MVAAGDDDQRIGKQEALLDVTDRCGIAQRADQEIDLAAPEAGKQIGIGTFQNVDRRVRTELPELGDGPRKHEGARKRHRTDNDPACLL